MTRKRKFTMIPQVFKNIVKEKRERARFVFVPGKRYFYCVHTQFPECFMLLNDKGICRPHFFDKRVGEKLSEDYKVSLMITALQTCIFSMYENINKKINKERKNEDRE